MKRWKDMNERQRNRRKKSMLRHAILALGAVGLTAVVALGALGAVRLIRSRRNAPLPTMEYISSGAAQNPLIFADEPGNETPPEASLPAGPAKDGEMVLQIGDEIHSETAILIDADENTVIAAKNCDATVYPASMTITSGSNFFSFSYMSGNVVLSCRLPGWTVYPSIQPHLSQPVSMP